MSNVKIVCLLGKVSSPDPSVVVNDEDATPNSSRWIFEVEQDSSETPAFDLHLLDKRTGKPRENGLLSITFTPIDAAAAGARLRAPEPDTPKLTIEADPVEGRIEYRVTIDVAHSLVS